jgi:hypothetical protein
MKMVDEISSFWIWNIDEHREEDIKQMGDCCFNQIISLLQERTQDCRAKLG